LFNSFLRGFADFGVAVTGAILGFNSAAL